MFAPSFDSSAHDDLACIIVRHGSGRIGVDKILPQYFRLILSYKLKKQSLGFCLIEVVLELILQ